MFVRSKTFLWFAFLGVSSSPFLLKNKQLEHKHEVPQKVRADKLSLNPEKSKKTPPPKKEEEKKTETPSKNGHNLH